MSIEANSTQTRLTPAQEALQALWEAHMASEFVQHDADAAIATMVPDAYVNDIPVMTGGVGLDIDSSCPLAQFPHHHCD